MRRGVLLSALLIGLWWSLLLPSWMVAGGEQISGADLNRTLALVPGIILLLALIALYGKLSRALLLIAAALSAATAIWTFSTDLESAPAVIAALERATGIAGGAGEVGSSSLPIVFAVVGALTAASLVLSAFGSRVPSRAVDESATDASDPRFIWDQQQDAD